MSREYTVTYATHCLYSEYRNDCTVVSETVTAEGLLALIAKQITSADSVLHMLTVTRVPPCPDANKQG